MEKYFDNVEIFFFIYEQNNTMQTFELKKNFYGIRIKKLLQA